jgi:hypothetical protein
MAGAIPGMCYFCGKTNLSSDNFKSVENERHKCEAKLQKASLSLNGS